mmetsp:Transcript_20226/g.47207  ORF Transcript_20226/g.47207 Transcript_20226/m.47207 type:complete len:80 (+) Transcript_20226:780-1019(+)
MVSAQARVTLRVGGLYGVNAWILAKMEVGEQPALELGSQFGLLEGGWQRSILSSSGYAAMGDFDPLEALETALVTPIWP